ncbi:phasin family protein [Roseospira marina]|uniref:Phasin family protein n=1 Tax=Roseospira marina TaxID=140057 RepID=A0A5M6I7Z3_9PROT|nr:phasin family protein [Roseospira marina]KAA5603859.1 phasin family protein [Roseospira marina]MBB4313722.1 phasin family protein [Roseospira marina]MBB5086884.1 phasin family protein [Roseospira marina]
MIRSYEDLMTFNKDNLDAATAASKLLAKGFEDISKEAVAFSSKSMDGAVAAGKQLGACKTPADFTNLQTKLVKDNWDAMIAQSKKMVELSNTVMRSAMEPVQARTKVVLDGFARA